MIIYVGDGSDMVRRVKSNHCSSNVEGSALRKSVAKAKGWRLSYTKRLSGSTRVRIDSADPKRDEKTVSDYIRAGSWRLVACASSEEANDFQWFAIKQLNPLCNITRRVWDVHKEVRYRQLLRQLSDGVPMTLPANPHVSAARAWSLCLGARHAA